jgi:hypothetical protein
MEKHGLRFLETQHGEQDSETSDNTMVKQIEVHGQRVKLYSQDGGRTWSSNPQSIVAYGQKKKILHLELQNSFQRIDETRDLLPDNSSERDTAKSLTKAKKKNNAHRAVVKVQLARLDTGRCADNAVSGSHARRLDSSGDQVGLLDHGGFHRDGHLRGRRPGPDHLAR